MQAFHYFSLIVTFCIFFTTNLTANFLKRDYYTDEYCREHIFLLDDPKTNVAKKYLHLIPGVAPTCMHIECPDCNEVTRTIYPSLEIESEHRSFVWSCNCQVFYRWPPPSTLWLKKWEICKKSRIYGGYFDKYHNRYFSCFLDFLRYVDNNPECRCHWPERSKSAGAISDAAYSLFKDLFTNTSLSELLENLDLQDCLLSTTPDNGFTINQITTACICHCLLYSDYEWVCRDIESFAASQFPHSARTAIRNKLDDIRETLAHLFLPVYTECLKKHPTQKIKDELTFVRGALNISPFEIYMGKSSLPESHTSFVQDDETIQSISAELESYLQLPQFSMEEEDEEEDEGYNFIKIDPDYNWDEARGRPKGWQNSDALLTHGTYLNNLCLYKEAIQTLTQAIQLNRYNRNIYIERAMAYFETDELELALLDYETAQKLTDTSPFLRPYYLGLNRASYDFDREINIEFSLGLIEGAADGAHQSVSEFVPSVLDCCRGISHGLWAFASSPNDMSEELANSAYQVGEYIRSHSAQECLECVVPEIKDLSQSWDKLSDRQKGRKVGFIIGKYGVDIFLISGAVKGMQKVQALRRANTMCTLECCLISEATEAKIIEQSLKHAALREKIVADAIKNSKILIQNCNKQFHIMQPKHAWDKLIKLTGNIENDCKNVIRLLEENGMHLKKCQIETVTREGATIYVHGGQINGLEVRAYFLKSESGELFLNNAWVVTK